MEGEDTGRTPLKERSTYAGVMITVHFTLTVFYGTLTSVFLMVLRSRTA